MTCFKTPMCDMTKYWFNCLLSEIGRTIVPRWWAIGWSYRSRKRAATSTIRNSSSRNLSLLADWPVWETISRGSLATRRPKVKLWPFRWPLNPLTNRPEKGKETTRRNSRLLAGPISKGRVKVKTSSFHYVTVLTTSFSGPRLATKSRGQVFFILEL